MSFAEVGHVSRLEEIGEICGYPREDCDGSDVREFNCVSETRQHRAACRWRGTLDGIRGRKNPKNVSSNAIKGRALIVQGQVN